MPNKNAPMTRQDFLDNTWLKYPYFSQMFEKDSDWIFGKVAFIKDNKLTLRDSSNYELSRSPLSHPQLGVSFPASLIAPGDCLALKRDPHGLFTPYLLSPDLTMSPTTTRGREWQNFLAAIERYLVAQGFTHWRTPYLVTSSGVDAHIDFMKVQGVRTRRSYFLPTSPEFELKKAIASGEQKIFEIKSCFRDDDKTPIHLPEFTMLEWYRAYEDKWQLVRDFEDIVRAVSPMFGPEQNVTVKKISLRELFKDYLGFTLTPQTTQDELKALLVQKGQHFDPSDDWDDLFFRLYIQYIEPHLAPHEPVAIYDFPATQSSLARLTPEGWADRFEIYWRGIELLNAYQEQNNYYLVNQVVKNEINKRIHLEREAPAEDDTFMEAMKCGFPPCAGAAMGLDRLYMVLAMKESIHC